VGLTRSQPLTFLLAHQSHIQYKYIKDTMPRLTRRKALTENMLKAYFNVQTARQKYVARSRATFHKLLCHSRVATRQRRTVSSTTSSNSSDSDISSSSSSEDSSSSGDSNSTTLSSSTSSSAVDDISSISSGAPSLRLLPSDQGFEITEYSTVSDTS
jgi:hypothetical protein